MPTQTTLLTILPSVISDGDAYVLNRDVHLDREGNLIERDARKYMWLGDAAGPGVPGFIANPEDGARVSLPLACNVFALYSNQNVSNCKRYFNLMSPCTEDPFAQHAEHMPSGFLLDNNYHVTLHPSFCEQK